MAAKILRELLEHPMNEIESIGIFHFSPCGVYVLLAEDDFSTLEPPPSTTGCCNPSSRLPIAMINIVVIRCLRLIVLRRAIKSHENVYLALYLELRTATGFTIFTCFCT